MREGRDKITNNEIRITNKPKAAEISNPAAFSTSVRLFYYSLSTLIPKGRKYLSPGLASSKAAMSPFSAVVVIVRPPSKALGTPRVNDLGLSRHANIRIGHAESYFIYPSRFQNQNAAGEQTAGTVRTILLVRHLVMNTQHWQSILSLYLPLLPERNGDLCVSMVLCILVG